MNFNLLLCKYFIAEEQKNMDEKLATFYLQLLFLNKYKFY